MTYFESNNSASVLLPGFSDNSEIEYYVTANDGSGIIMIEDNEGNCYGVIVESPVPEFTSPIILLLAIISLIGIILFFTQSKLKKKF